MEQKKPRGTHRGVQRGEKAQQSTPCRHVCVRTHPRAKDLLQLPWYSLAGWSLSVLQGDCRGRKAKKWLKKIPSSDLEFLPMTSLGTGRADYTAGRLHLPWQLPKRAGRALVQSERPEGGLHLPWRFPHRAMSGFCHFCGCHFGWGGRRYTCNQTQKL